MEQRGSALSVLLPDGWHFKESLTLLAPDGQANVIASSEPLDEDFDTDRYAEAQGELLLNEFPGFHQYAFENMRIFGGETGWVRRFHWDPPDGVRVMQIQLYWARPGRGFTATATTPATEFPRFEDQLRQILEGLRINPDALRFDPRQTPWPPAAKKVLDGSPAARPISPTPTGEEAPHDD